MESQLENYLTVPQAAAVIGVSSGRVRQMLLAREITGRQFPPQENGRWLICADEAKRVRDTKSKRPIDAA